MSQHFAADGRLEFDAAEMQFLIACRHLISRKKQIASVAKIIEISPKLFEKESVDVSSAATRLKARGLIDLRSDGTIEIGLETLEIARELRTKHEQSGFGEWMTKSEASPAYLEFCRRVYGTPFVQFGMLDAEQLKYLQATIGLNRSDRILDLGCGIGLQAEFLADHSPASIVGIDFSKAAIDRAVERTTGKADRLRYLIGDFDNLDTRQLGKFTVIIAIDTLYFPEDLEKTLESCLNLLEPGGKIIAFWSQSKEQDDEESKLNPEGTNLAKTLSKLGLTFTAKDFTKNDEKLWELQAATAQEMKDVFEKEGNLELWQSRDSESQQVLNYIRNGAWRRYVYIATR